MPGRLEQRILARIAAGGPISVAEYMALCLSDPEDGYYVAQDPLGADGDFTTAPEISQLFGELIGAWLLDIWQRMGAPNPVRLVEFGPGRGTLMSDILRVAALRPAFRDAIKIHLIEISRPLRKRQERTLAASAKQIAWSSRFADVPPGPVLIVANEFFDALPIHQYSAVDGRWHERLVGRTDDNRLRFTCGPATLASPLAAENGAVIETCPAAQAVMAEISERIGNHGGAALVVDYGYEGPTVGDTLQAIRQHKHVDPLADPGNADLAAHVDFTALKRVAVANGIHCHGPMPQGAFLIALGLLERAGRLGSGKDEKTRKSITDAVERLAGGDQMGQLFKVMAAAPPGIRPLPFDDD